MLPPKIETPQGEPPEPIVAKLVEARFAGPANELLGNDARGQGDTPDHKDAQVYGVPRRFGIGTILIITTAFGLLLSLLQAVGAHPGVIAFIVIFVSVVGAAQMLLFGGREPRRASVVAGLVFLPLMMVGAVALSGSRGPRAAWGCSLTMAVLFGGGFGYLAGGVVAGVFLIMDAVEQALRYCRGQPASDERPDAS